MATLINGDGNQAVYAAQDADFLSGAITNNKTVILDVGEKFRAEVLSSSIIEVHDGVILTKEGRRIQLDQNAVDLFEFPAGAQGVVSWYYIGYKLEIDEDSHQICSTFVQKMDSEGDTIPEGSFREGDQEVYISLYHVQQDTLGVLTPTLVLTEFMTATDILDNLIGSASDLPDPTKTISKNIEQINSDLTNKADRSELPAHITTAITLDPSNISYGVRIDSLYEKTVGNVIALSMDFTTSVVKTSLSTLFTITDAVSTPTTYYLFMLGDADAAKPVYFEIDQYGHIKNIEELPTGRYFGTFVYVTT
jgi:hypothetical protein